MSQIIFILKSYKFVWLSSSIPNKLFNTVWKTYRLNLYRSSKLLLFVHIQVFTLFSRFDKSQKQKINELMKEAEGDSSPSFPFEHQYT